ncbi:MAG: Malonyl-(acyl-carrier protein) O-methyltransferase [Planctomycetes bacterium ADurb.Bin069]|nr:MAG: Malonyl-(acyl-carrier protein) O-methyltransferase [Planctomycetes bacterium ADurb.Bin069]
MLSGACAMPTIVPDPAVVSRNFSRAAGAYDAHAVHQRRIAARLSALLPDRLAPAAVLELGCGTGILTALLRERFPAASITAIDIAPGMIAHCRARRSETASFLVGDAESFPEADADLDRPELGAAPRVFDLVASSSSFQWFRDRRAALANARARLAPGGVFALAAPVEGTLGELAASFSAAMGAPWPHLAFGDADQYAEMCRAAGLACLRLCVEDVPAVFPDPFSALSGLRDIGAGFAGHAGFAPLGLAAMRRLLAHYRARFAAGDGAVTATYRVLYLFAEAR